MGVVTYLASEDEVASHELASQMKCGDHSRCMPGVRVKGRRERGTEWKGEGWEEMEGGRGERGIYTIPHNLYSKDLTIGSVSPPSRHPQSRSTHPPLWVPVQLV